MMNDDVYIMPCLDLIHPPSGILQLPNKSNHRVLKFPLNATPDDIVIIIDTNRIKFLSTKYYSSSAVTSFSQTTRFSFNFPSPCAFPRLRSAEPKP